MAMQKRFRVGHGDVFPKGAFIKGEVEKVIDFDKSTQENRVQAVDLNKAGEGTGLPLWQVIVLDADEEAGKKDTAVTVKIAAKHQPVPPENKTPFPWTMVEFVGLTALPYVEYTGSKDKDGHDRTRIVWSFRAEGMVAPGQSASQSAGSSASKGAA
ncbi:plasmid replication, integration and excision activator [Terrabacter sp. GCM10028922]|uniref:plasmid replication, integration and excision activator n=1 Tax=Terrabacter sp. GCM10028922 TaxID=3273428 RepID=UPI00361D80F4